MRQIEIPEPPLDPPDDTRFTCELCESTVDVGDTSSCRNCGEVFCDDCFVKCIKCERLLCWVCADDACICRECALEAQEGDDE